jgi:glycosyltransferase involved in cell wall biosynthesis
MDITLIIPAYNEERYIGATLDAARQAGRGRFKEIVVVDNASTDNTAAVAREHGARVVSATKKGLTHARQAGYEATASDLIAFIDADTLISARWFDIAEGVFGKRHDAVSLSGPRRYFGTAWWRCWTLNAMWGMAPITYAAVGCMLLGGNFIVRRSAIREIGGFDTQIEFYGEDTDLARRLSKIGKTIFRMDFVVHASARRFDVEGIVMPNLVYALNYLWPILFHKPFTHEYRDVR